MESAGQALLVHLERFDLAVAAGPAARDGAIRRFATLLVEAEVPHGYGRPARVYRVRNTAGEVFALKTLRPLAPVPAKGAGAARARRAGGGAPQAAAPLPTPVETEAFFEGYRSQVAVSGIRGFPEVYGYGAVEGGTPAFLMQWVDGVTLADARAQGLLGAEGALPARTVAELGAAVLEALARTEILRFRFVHRDLSPKNIMIKTAGASVADQSAAGSFDVALVDLGSSASARDIDPGFTMQSNVFRNGTPAYAAPEMLTNDIAGIEGLRRSPAVDVYALASVLYELYAGTAPFARQLRDSPSPYRTKVEGEPEPLEPRGPADEGLVRAIMAGIRSAQGERISQRDLLRALRAWLAGEEVEIPGPAAQPSREDGGRALPGGGPKLPSPGKGTGAGGISRRGLVRGACLGAAAAALAGAGVATRGFGILDRMNGIRPALEDYSWGELSELAGRIAEAKSGKCAKRIAIDHHLLLADGTFDDSSVKEVELADGTKAHVRLIGIRHDALADGSGRSGLTFLFCEAIAARPMNGAPVTAGGWETCGLRSWLEGEGRALLPADLRRELRTVIKVTNNSGAARETTALTETEERLWLPSYCEIAGDRAVSSFSKGYGYLAPLLNGEGAQYAHAAQHKPSYKGANGFLQLRYRGKDCYWWLRTPSADVSGEQGLTYLNRVGVNGDPFSYACESSLAENPEDSPAGVNAVVPGFCL